MHCNSMKLRIMLIYFQDVLGRRLRLAFLNAGLAMECLPRVIDIMASELDWSADRKASEYKDAVHYLQTMGLNTD